MNIPKLVILDTLNKLYSSFEIHLNQLKFNYYNNYIIVTWIDEYGYKEKFKIIADKDFKNPNTVSSNQQFTYNNKLFQLLLID